MQQDYVSTISRNAGVPFMEYICSQHDDLEYGQSLHTAWEFAGIHSTDQDYLWGSHGVQMVSTHARAVYGHHRLFAQFADPRHALRLGPTQPIGPGSPVIQSRFQRPEDSSQILEPVWDSILTPMDILSYTCPQVTLTLSPVSLIFPAAYRRWSYWVCPYSNYYTTMSSSPTVHPPRTLCCLLWLCSYLSCFWSMPNTHSQVWLGGYLINPWSTPTTLSHPSASCGYHNNLSLENAYHARPSTSCSYVASHQSLEYAHHAQPGVAMWLSHPSLEYAHLSASASCGYVAISLIPGVRTPRSARCGYVAISPIPGVRPLRPPLCLCQLWLRGYLTYPWSTHTTPSQVWLCDYLTHPWSTPSTPTSLPLPAVAMWLSHLSMEYAHHAQPGVAMWLSHPSLKYAHHAHFSASASCGYVAISLIPGSCPPRPPFYQLWLRGFSSIPQYAHHAQPDVSISPIPGVRPPRPPSASCGYVAISLIPGACLPRPLFYQLWLCGYATNPWSTPNAPSHLPGVAMRPSPVSLEYARHAHPLSVAAAQLSHLSLKYTHPTASCGYTTSHLALEYAHHAQPAAGVVAMWPSHFSPAGI